MGPARDSAATRIALWMVRAGALVSVVSVAVACAAKAWHPHRALTDAVVLSAPYAAVLASLTLPHWRGRAGWSVLLAGLTAVPGLIVFALVAPDVAWDDLGWLPAAAVKLFPLAQVGLAGGALGARRAFPMPVLGRLRTSLAALAGLLYLVPIAGVLGPSFERPPYVTNEASAVGHVRSVVSAQLAFEAVTGSYGTLECLVAPSDCVPGRSVVPFLLGENPGASVRRGYRFELHGTPVPEREGALSSFAYVAVPLETRSFPGWRRTGRRGFCGDATGRICYTEDGSAPRVENGSCARPCREYQP